VDKLTDTIRDRPDGSYSERSPNCLFRECDSKLRVGTL
jgi:hypothetical protein